MKTRILGIDPGPKESGFVVLDGEKILFAGIKENEDLLMNIRSYYNYDRLVVEKVCNYGMAVGEAVFDTVFWTGMFCSSSVCPYHRIPRMDVKMHICHSSRAADKNIIVALIDRFDRLREFGRHGKGTIKNKGPLFGFKSHMWQALALAITWYELNI